MKCKNCGYDIRPGETGVREWIHTLGFYQCPGMWGQGLNAEPEDAHSTVSDHGNGSNHA